MLINSFENQSNLVEWFEHTNHYSVVVTRHKDLKRTEYKIQKNDYVYDMLKVRGSVTALVTCAKSLADNFPPTTTTDTKSEIAKGESVGVVDSVGDALSFVLPVQNNVLKNVSFGGLPRIVCHFSCGAASAVATYLAIQKYGKDNVTIVNIHIAEEHPDNQRFLKDCEEWFGKEIHIIKDEKFNASIYEVFKRTNFLRSPQGAPCTTRLKRMVRANFSRPDDLNIYGFTVEEFKRAEDFQDRNPDIKCEFPLLDKHFTKSDCLGSLELFDIKIPVMYQLGYNNNNCIGCVKGGMGYWNKIRKDFPNVFQDMAKLEREIGHSILKDKNGSLYLDQLEPNRGRIEDEPDIECSFICRSAFDMSAESGFFSRAE